ncbi:hypothetical protein SteCoe_6488 [Stentor coeruleus]|uniref:Amidohydrolase-related domain-containing protein n=1 Tax=Stentor coeruleus TaxID=5963 RepID=A0A1R2CPU1_9CILI|nr:hypothetical protein SteCoe_6488 [Stentor coeruleus]
MSRFGIVSKHIVLTSKNNSHPRYPCPGIILINNDTIEDIILQETLLPFETLIKQYKDWNLLDYRDLYISPGIIDLNVRREWEDFSQLTKAALNGGVTVIAVEEGYYNPISTSSIYYCDIAKIILANDQTNFSAIPKSVCALKGYLFPPSTEIRSIAYLQNIMKEANKTGLPFFIDATLPDPRMLYMASPSRLLPVDDRKDTDTNSSGLFAAAYPESMSCTKGSDSEESEEESEDEEIPQRSTSLACPELRQLNIVSNSILDDEEENKIKVSEQSLVIAEVKESDESSPLKKGIKKKAISHDIYNDLDNRIKASQQNIEDLCIAERSTYSFSGSTSFISADLSNQFQEMNLITSKPIEAPLKSIPPDNSKPQTSKLIHKRDLFRPSPIVIKPEIRPDASRDYKYYLANLPEHWEISGIERIIENLTSGNKIHFQNTSSAAAINRIRQIKKTYNQITCEIPATHLFFNSIAVKIGDTRFKNIPPIRNQGNFNLLWDLLKMKGIDSISSQHASIETHRKITGNFQQALNGISAMGCSLQAVWTMINIPATTSEQLEHYIVRLAKWFSLHPAMILNINNKRGSIEKGKFADFIVWNPKEKVVVSNEYAYSETSPFMNQELLGCIKYVYLRGKLATTTNGSYFGEEIFPEHYK